MPLYELGRKLKRSNLCGLRKWVNLTYYNPATVILTTKSFDFVEVDGCKFRMNDQVDSVQRVKDNPWFDNVRPKDTVLDIGANIGAITIPLAKVAKKVFAVEPLFHDLLSENIELNELKNVKILPFALGGQYRKIEVSFGPRKGYSDCKTFQELKKICGGRIDFLKCDCEGEEWRILPQELEGIRELRIEFHVRRGRVRQDRRLFAQWCQWFEDNGYEKDISFGIEPGPCVPFSQCILLRASKKEVNG